MNPTDQMTVKVLFQGSTSGLPVQGFVRDLDRVGDAAGRTNRSVDGIGMVAKSALATGGVAAAVAFGRALLDAADSAAAVQRGVIGIGTQMGYLNPAQVKAMSAELGRLSIVSGQALEPLVKARYDIVSAGFTEAAESAEVLTVATHLAVGGMTDVDAAADVLTTKLNAYGESSAKAAESADDLTTTVRLGKSTLEEISASLGQVISIAAPAGVSFDELGASVGALTAIGQKPAEAITSVRSAIVELMKPGSDLAKVLDAANIKSTDLIETGHGLTGALNLLRQAEERTGVPVKDMIQNTEALKAIMPLLSTASERYSANLAEMANNAGEADRNFKELSSSSAALKEQAGAAFAEVKRQIGEAIIDSETYKGVLLGIKGLFAGIAGESATTAASVSADASTMELSYRALGGTIRAAFDWAVKAKEQWDKFNGTNRWFHNMETMAKDAVAKKASVGTANIANSYSADDNAGILSAYNAAKDRGASAVARPAVSSPVIKSLSGGSGGGSSSKSFDAAAREMQRGLEDTAKALDTAVEWYAKEYEAVEGLYDAQKKYEESVYNLAILKNSEEITSEEFIEKTRQASIALEMLQASANAAAVAAVDASFAANPDLFGLGTEADNQYGKKVEKTTSAIYDLGSQLENRGIAIKGWDSFAKSYESFAEYLDPANQALAEGKNYSGLYKGIGLAVSGIGEAIGGGIGDALSSAASMALTGFELTGGNPIGAVVGGVVGLVSSIFGGGSNEEADRAQRDDMRRQIYDNMIQSALSGGTESIALLRAGNYKYNQVANLPDVYAGNGNTRGYDNRLFEDRSEETLPQLQEILNVLDQAGITVNNFMRPSLLRDLDTASVLFEYSVAQVGDLAELTEAYQSQLIMAITGVSADTLQSALTDAIDNNSAADAGQAFVGKYEEGIKASIRNMAVSQMVDDIMMPALTPILQGLTASMMAGDYTAASMSAYLSQAMTVMDTLSPVVTALASAFEGGGVSAGYSKTVNPSNYSTAAEYRRALAGIPGYADGGEMADGWKVVGERSWELMHTGPGRVISHNDSSKMLDNRPLAGQIELLRQEMQESQDVLERHVSNLYDLFDRWRQDDFTVKVS